MVFIALNVDINISSVLALHGFTRMKSFQLLVWSSKHKRRFEINCIEVDIVDYFVCIGLSVRL